MAERHPYATSPTYILQILDQLRKVFPEKVDADTLKRYGIAQSNEGTVINVLRYLNIIDENNSRTKDAHSIFSERELEVFQDQFSSLVKSSYKDLFDLHGDNAWDLSLDKLITFFRKTDLTSERLGKEQARTFQTLSSYGGKTSNLPVATNKPAIAPRPQRKAQPKSNAVKSEPSKAALPTINPVETLPSTLPLQAPQNGVALTVRIEINLPVATDQETYDRIFKSIRENLLNGQ